MSLTTWLPLRDEISVPGEGGSMVLPLYGLRADAIAFLINNHFEAAAAAYTLAAGGGLTAERLPGVLSQMLEEAPIFVATVIAFGADEPDAIEQAARLPLETQIEAVEKIFKLTFAGEFPPKKSLAVARQLLESLHGLKGFVNGSTESAKT